MQRPELNPGGVLFLGRGDRKDLEQLEAVLMAGLIIQPTTTTTTTTSTTAGSFAPSPPSPSPSVMNRVVAIFTEFPCNPLLTCPDLHQLTALSRRYGVMLVVDDTIASFANVDLLHSDGR
jgi:aspartate/methionine/tyrosine aminotransferase